ncbi:nucleotidyltransferase family protein [Paenisporosarcina macmurdoensis]|uniref:Nucleotidyltransferase family protein n=1 Tax=Paenisporosarcina macmurdoensis TaxID=212659 RepID=A0ABW1LB67_9BACL
MNKELINQLRLIVKWYPEIESVSLFGSRAYGDNTETSDIDLAVVAPKLSDIDWLNFSEQVENELNTLLKIDLIRWETASNKLKDEINACQQIIIRNAPL